jgi:hypothetical protein
MLATAVDMIITHQRQVGTYDDPDAQALRQLLSNLQTEVTARLRSTATSVTGSRVSPMSTPQSTRPSLTPRRPQAAPNPPPISSVIPDPTTLPLLHAPLIDSFFFDMSTVRMDLDSSSDGFDMMNIDWEALALAYDLPSQ